MSLNTLILAWVTILLGSLLPSILWNEFIGANTIWLTWARLVYFAAIMIASLFLSFVRPLRPIAVVLFTLYAAAEIVSRLNFTLPFLQAILGNSLFIQKLQPEQFSKLGVSLAMIVVLFLLGYKRPQMFLVPGNLKAPITPVRWLGFPKPDSWVWFGGQFSIYLALGVAVVLWITGRPSFSAVEKTLPVLPAILLMAALNAFNEEVFYRSAFLAALESVVGKRQVWWMCALFFGIAHFYGVPHGWIGIGLATFMGWMLTKAMLETRGFFWPWWIHFLQDCVIFFFIAMGTVVPGG